jgi:hypothetical protein
MKRFTLILAGAVAALCIVGAFCGQTVYSLTDADKQHIRRADKAALERCKEACKSAKPDHMAECLKDCQQRYK